MPRFTRASFVAVVGAVASCSGTVVIVDAGAGGLSGTTPAGAGGMHAGSNSATGGSPSSGQLGGGGGAPNTTVAVGGGGGSCGNGLTQCGNACADLNSDVQNCGACMKACSNANGATACIAGGCSPTCSADFADCDGNAANGCETPLATTANCGGCKKTCTNPHGTTACAAGACIPTCDAGFDSCDANGANGCETNIQTDATHCGTCATTCGASQLCASAVCHPCIVQVATGNHTCARRGDGTLWCWGGNFYGALGNGGNLNATLPIQTVAAGTSIKGVTVGYEHTCAWSTDGSLSCWGWNADGQLGDATQVSKSLPVKITVLGSTVADAASHFKHTCARKSDGTLWCWGFNQYGQIGDGTALQRLAPVQVSSLGAAATQVVAGFYHTCALKTDGTLWCWGRNHVGQLGDGTTVDNYLPVHVSSLGNSVIQIAAGADHVCARKTDGTLWCWGANLHGQLGNGGNANQSFPIQVSSLGASVVQVAAGWDATCARKTDSSTWCWGSNSEGQVGDGTTVDKVSPTNVSKLGTTAVDLVAGVQNACAAEANGTLWCWGANDGGQVGDGDNTKTPKLAPAMTGLACP